MQSDLLPAKAVVDWAVSQLPIFEQRIVTWLEGSPYRYVREFDAQRCKDAIKVKIDTPLPLIVNAEAGIIIHSIRSSLDLLAVALAERNGHLAPKDVYFPICESLTAFLDTRPGGGAKKIARLSDADKLVIENLKPYQGGNDLLYSLHKMDVLRKHQSLIATHADLGRMTLGGPGIDAEFPVSWPSFENETVLVWIARDAPNYDLDITCEITLTQTPTLVRMPAADSLRNFASLAYTIINLFR